MHPDESTERVREAIATIEIDVRRLMPSEPASKLPGFASKMERALAEGNAREARDHALMVMVLLVAYKPTEAAAAAAFFIKVIAITWKA